MPLTHVRLEVRARDRGHSMRHPLVASKFTVGASDHHEQSYNTAQHRQSSRQGPPESGLVPFGRGLGWA